MEPSAGVVSSSVLWVDVAVTLLLGLLSCLPNVVLHANALPVSMELCLAKP